MLSGEVEADDFFLAARDRTRRRGPGRGTDRQPMLAAVERSSGRRGRCAPGVVPDCGGASWGAFASGHVDGAAHVRADGWPGITSGLRAWPGLDQRKFDARDRDASLPTVHHVISNFKSWAAGTFHGLSTVRLQAYADEFSWRYSHRGCDATTALVADCCLGYYRRDQLHREVFGPQPPAAPARGRPRRGRRPDILRL